MHAMKREPRRARGVSMVETSVATSVLASMTLAAFSVMGATNDLGQRSSADLAACMENRRALQHIANVLRSASFSSLAEFDAHGNATAPQFKLVLGQSGGAVSHGPTTTLRWRAGWRAGSACAGVANPGSLVLQRGGATVPIAAHVPQGGFTVTQVGGTLRIHLETYSPMGNGEVAHASGDTTVAIRN
jgi:hypothetical protein